MKFLVTCVLLFLNTTQAQSCSDAQVKIIFEGKPIVTKETMCTIKTPDKMLFYVSKSCQNYNCDILKKRKSSIEIKNYYNNIGSPGFKLCFELGGIPQIFEFSNGADHWQSTERCIFNSLDFVEISLLTSEWKNFIRHQ